MAQPHELPGRIRTLSVALPPGREIRGDEGADEEPAMWASDGPVTAELWSSLRAEHRRSGLWPLLLDTLGGDPRRPWDDGELWPAQMSSPDDYYPGALLGGWWSTYADTDEPWPGLSARRKPRVDPDEHADACTRDLLQSKPGLRLGLVVAGRGSDALCAAGWQGAVNYTNDTAELSTVLRSWEDRFGVRVIAAGFAELYLSVAAPPPTVAERVAAEHFAFCPDNVWQGAGSLTDYAAALVGAPMWSFWWD